MLISFAREAESTDLDVDPNADRLNTRLSRSAQVIPDKVGQALAAWRSEGKRTSVLVIRFTPLPRWAGVICPRQR